MHWLLPITITILPIYILLSIVDVEDDGPLKILRFDELLMTVFFVQLLKEQYEY